MKAKKARLKEEYNFSETVEDNLHQELLLMPYMLNIPKIFQDSSLGQKHAILNQVFKQDLTFREGAFRIPSINLEFEHKVLRIKERGLL